MSGLYTGPDKPAGLIIISGPDMKDLEIETKQCVHCGAHWIPIKGSGRPHVWCGKCRGNTCSDPKCLAFCYPEEKRAEDMSKYGYLIWPTS